MPPFDEFSVLLLLGYILQQHGQWAIESGKSVQQRVQTGADTASARQVQGTHLRRILRLVRQVTAAVQVRQHCNRTDIKSYEYRAREQKAVGSNRTIGVATRMRCVRTWYLFMALSSAFASQGSMYPSPVWSSFSHTCFSRSRLCVKFLTCHGSSAHHDIHALRETCRSLSLLLISTSTTAGTLCSWLALNCERRLPFRAGTLRTMFSASVRAIQALSFLSEMMML